MNFSKKNNSSRYLLPIFSDKTKTKHGICKTNTTVTIISLSFKFGDLFSNFAFNHVNLHVFPSLCNKLGFSKCIFRFLANFLKTSLLALTIGFFFFKSSSPSANIFSPLNKSFFKVSYTKMFAILCRFQ